MNPKEVFWSGRSKAEVVREVEEEMAFHVEELVHQYVLDGKTREQAEHLAAVQFGDRERIAKQCVQERIGDQLMWQKIHLAFTLTLLVAVGVMAQRSLHARAFAEQQARSSEAAAAQWMERFSEARVFGVGDEMQLIVECDSNRWQYIEVVQPDGVILLPDYGWLLVAGRNASQVESDVEAALQLFYAGKVRAFATFLRPAAGEASPVREWVLRPGDQLSVVDLNGSFETKQWPIVVSTERKARFPDIGTVSVAGMNRTRMEAKLTELYDYLYAQPVDIKVRLTRPVD